MSLTQYLICLLFSHFSWAFLSDNGCPYKECVCAVPQIFCQNLQLNSIPALTTTRDLGYRYLTFDPNSITAIPAGSLPINLIEISFMNNPILTVDDSAFDGSSSTLETLQFANALFTRIPAAFQRLHNLKRLTIYDTDILDWNLDAIRIVGQTLQTLYLENVGLKTWPMWMQYISHLTELSIVDSSMSSIPDDALDKLNSSLTTLTFIHTNLTSISKTFSTLGALESLQLLDNKISNITWMPRQSKLSSLSFNNNNISDASQVSNALRAFAGSMADVDLQGNQLRAIPELSFLTKVGSFQFSHNQISDTASGSLPSGVYYLNLGSNSLPSIPLILLSLQSLSRLVISLNAIKEIRGTDLLPSVMDLDLGYNLITEIIDASFPPDSKIISLLLNNNPITRISQLAFKNLQSLTDLDLQSTKLKRLPLGLASLTRLISFDISNSADLVCTCLEKSLAPWLLKLEHAFGDCGQTSVYDFFVSLSSACPE